VPGLSAALRFCTSLERVPSVRGFCASAPDRSSASLFAAAGEGLRGPCDTSVKSRASCCFCAGVTVELTLIAARSVCNFARACCGVSVLGAVVAGLGAVGGGWVGGTPCRTLFWLLRSLARCLIMASEPAATTLSAMRLLALTKTNICFIDEVRHLADASTLPERLHRTKGQEKSNLSGSAPPAPGRPPERSPW